MNYQQTIELLYSKLPVFTRVGVSAYKKDLHNTLALCNALGNPEKKIRTLHIAGTNGKGSTSHMLAAILQTAGYKTGLYTSPHLKDFRERIRINGKMMPKSEVSGFVTQHEALITEIEPSFFEATVAMAFNHFAVEQVDIAVIEVGLGGRLDSTNIINPELSVITNISFDHVNILGNTIEAIAIEKAGIIKANTPVVIGQTQDDAKEVFMAKAKLEKAPIIFADQALKVSKVSRYRNYLQMDILQGEQLLFEALQLDLTGTYQLKNILTVLQSVIELRKKGFNISDEQVRTALKQVKKLTGLQGRWQTLSKKPLVICDTGHNEDGIHEVLKNIASTSFHKLHLVIGMVKDKDVTKVLSLLPPDADYYFCSPAIERGLEATELSAKAKELGLQGEVYPSVKAALQAAKAGAASNDLVFVGGSTFVVAEII